VREHKGETAERERVKFSASSRIPAGFVHDSVKIATLTS
jgi:hypothetical protein